MSEVVRETTLPKGGLLAIAGLVLFSLAAVTTVRLTGVGGTKMTLPAMVESRDLLFEDGKDGAVLVLDAQHRSVVDVLPPGSNGFVRVVLRGLARERRASEIGAEPPFRLSRFENGQFTLLDTSTGKLIDLSAFGSVNSGAFARLINARSDGK